MFPSSLQGKFSCGWWKDSIHFELQAHNFTKKARLYCIGNLRSLFLMIFADVGVLCHYLPNYRKCIHIGFRTLFTADLFPYQSSARLDLWSQEIMALKQRDIKISIQLLKQQNKAAYLQLQCGINYICNTEGSGLHFTLHPNSEQICSGIFTKSNSFLLTHDF